MPKYFERVGVFLLIVAMVGLLAMIYFSADMFSKNQILNGFIFLLLAVVIMIIGPALGLLFISHATLLKNQNNIKEKEMSVDEIEDTIATDHVFAKQNIEQDNENTVPSNIQETTTVSNKKCTEKVENSINERKESDKNNLITATIQCGKDSTVFFGNAIKITDSAFVLNKKYYYFYDIVNSDLKGRKVSLYFNDAVIDLDFSNSKTANYIYKQIVTKKH